MTMMFAIPTGWDEATEAANRWRGHMIRGFTRGEAAVSEALAALAKVEGRGASVRLRQLLGQRLEDLDAALAPTGPFGAEGEGAARALATFREDQDLRTLLCHGHARVWLSRNGGWALQLRLLTFRGGASEATCRFIDQQEAEALLKRVMGRCRSVEAALAALRTTVAD